MAETETLVYLVDIRLDDIDGKTTQVQNFKKALEEIPTKGKEAGEGLHHANEGAKELSEGLRGGSEALRKWTEEFASLGAEVPVFNTALTGATQASRTFVTEGLTVAGVAAFTVALAGATAELVGLGAEWQHTFTSLAVAAGQPVEAVGELKTALEGLNVPFATAEMAEALTTVVGRVQQYTGQALSATQATQLMTAASNLAVASGQSLASATQALVQQMIASRTGFEDVAQVSDVLFNATRLTGVSIDGLAQAMGRIQARMGDSAPEIGQVATVLDILSNAGLSGNRAMMLMFQAMESLVNPSETAKHALETLGVEVAYTKDGQLDAIETIVNLKRALEGIADPTERQAAEVDIMGHNYGLLQDLIRPTVEQIEAMHEAVTEHNTAMEGAEKHADDLRERLEKLGKQITDTAANLGTEMAGALIADANLFDTLGTAGSKAWQDIENAYAHYYDTSHRAPEAPGPPGVFIPPGARIGEQDIQNPANPAHNALDYSTNTISREQVDRALNSPLPVSPPGATQTEIDAGRAIAEQMRADQAAAQANFDRIMAEANQVVADAEAGAATPEPSGATGTYESAEQKKQRLEQEKVAASYELEQRTAALEAAREQSRLQERINQQVDAYTEKFGAGAEIGGKALENLEREADLRDRQYQAAQEIVAVENAHADAIEEVKRGWEDVNNETKEAREDSRHQVEVDREISGREQEVAHETAEYKISQDRTVSDYGQQLAREDADYEKSQRRETSAYDQQLTREDADYKKSQEREASDYATQLGRQRSQDALGNSRSERDAQIDSQRSREDLERTHGERVQQIRTQGGPNAGAQLQQEEEAYKKQIENLERSEQRRRQDEARHREDRQQDETIEQSYHTAELSRTRARHDVDVALTRDRHAEDLRLRTDYHTVDAAERRKYHADDLAEATQRHTADMDRARDYWEFQFAQREAYYHEDIGTKRADETTDTETARSQAAMLRDEARAHQLDMTAGSGGLRDQIEHAYGIAPEQIAAANAQRQKQEAFLTLQRDLTRETAANQERIADAAERQAITHERVLREYTEKGGNPANLPAPQAPSISVPSLNLPTPAAPATPGGTAPSIELNFNFEGFSGSREQAQEVVNLISPILLSQVRGMLMAGRSPS